MTTFTRITLDLRDPQTRALTRNRNRMHAILATATKTDETTDAHARYLWRRDHGRLYLVADHLDTQTIRDRLNTTGIDTTPYQPFLDRLATGQTRPFTIEANPVTIHDGTRKPIKDPDGRIQWIQRKLTAAGCNDIQAMIETVHVDRFRKNNTNHDQVTIQTIRYRGLLTITDPARLANALTAGIGPAKAYGLGLLTLGTTISQQQNDN